MEPNDNWGAFRIVRFLGSGNMGEVFLAHNQFSGKDVAVKRVRRAPGAEGEEKIEAERTGADLERRLSDVDPRVTKVYSFGEIEGDLFIEMEYVEGRDLSVVLSEGQLLPGRAAVIALELCEMLVNLGISNVIHGDLKPKNIRIDEHDRIRVMDFGVAKALAKSRDQTVALFGSIAYCSPERLDSGEMTLASDLWSVGVMLYEMLAASLPFQGARPELLERRIRSGAAPAPLPDSVPEPLRRICIRMLAPRIADRYQSPGESHADLKHFLNGEPVPEYVFADADRTVRTQQQPAATPPRPNLSWLLTRRTVAVGLSVLLALFIVIWAMVRPHYRAWADTRELKHDIESEHVTVDTAWTRYKGIADRKKVSMAMWGIGSPLEAKLIAEGDKPIVEFRNSDYPSVKEGTWRRSVTYFSRALELEPGDKNIKAKLRVCEGHLERIGANNRQAMLNDADLKFHEAADLMRKSPDPWLGLARLYAYNMNDLERAQQALDEAAKRGHPESRREMFTMAEGYASRALQEVRDADQLHSVRDSQMDALHRSRSDYEHARVLYAQLGSFSNAPVKLLRSVDGIATVDNRMKELNP